MYSFTDSAPSIGLYYFLSLTLSVCMYVCLSRSFKSILLFLFLDGIEPFLGRQFSMWHSTKRCSSILGPVTSKIYSPKFGTKSPVGRLVWQIDRRCLGLLGGFRGWPIQWNHTKCCGADPCCHGNEILANLGYFCTKSSIRRLVDRPDMFAPTRGLTFVAMATSFALGTESKRLLAC